MSHTPINSLDRALVAIGRTPPVVMLAIICVVAAVGSWAGGR